MSNDCNATYLSCRLTSIFSVFYFICFILKPFLNLSYKHTFTHHPSTILTLKYIDCKNTCILKYLFNALKDIKLINRAINYPICIMYVCCIRELMYLGWKLYRIMSYNCNITYMYIKNIENYLLYSNIFL